MKTNCKKCLLYEAGEMVTYDEIMKYVATLDKNETVSECEYERRIAFCKQCDFLISGMCRKCGCFVEVRARLKNKDCPNVDNPMW